MGPLEAMAMLLAAEAQGGQRVNLEEQARKWLLGMGERWGLSVLRDPAAALAGLWHSRTDAEVADGVEAWYRRARVSAAYVLDLAHWHTVDPGPLLMAAQVKMHVDKRRREHRMSGRSSATQCVLDFGAGIGTTAIVVSETSAARVDMLECGPWLRAFAAERMIGSGVRNVRLVDEPKPPYDVVVAIDVPEHLDYPDVWLRHVHDDLLSEDGSLVTVYSFEDPDGRHPQHMLMSDPRAQGFLAALDELFDPPIPEAQVVAGRWPEIRRRRGS